MDEYFKESLDETTMRIIRKDMLFRSEVFLEESIGFMVQVHGVEETREKLAFWREHLNEFITLE